MRRRHNLDEYSKFRSVRQVVQDWLRLVERPKAALSRGHTTYATQAHTIVIANEALQRERHRAHRLLAPRCARLRIPPAGRAVKRYGATIVAG